MNFNKEKIKYFDVIVAVIITFVIIQLMINYKTVFEIIGKSINIIYPFILAFIIAYILRPLINIIETKLKIKRTYSILLTYTMIIGFIAVFFILMLPKLFSSLADIMQNVPNFTAKGYSWINDVINKSNISKLISSIDFMKDNTNTIIQKFSLLTSSWLNILLDKTVSFTNSLINLVFGLIISIYILYDKEKFIDNGKKLIYITFRKSMGKKIIDLLSNLDRMIGIYIGTKAIDSMIIGGMCFIGLLVLKSPYVLLISVIVAITNMIPYFGPFIGMIPAFMINVFYDPKRAIWILIFLILLQQFDAWFLEPKLVGDKVGLSPFLIILGITIGGSLFGVIGMLLASPVTAVINIYVSRWFDNSVKKHLT